jgi:hypothetical protein
MKHYHAAIAASLMHCSSYVTDVVRPGFPLPLLTNRTAPRHINAAFGPGRSGCVRVYPDRLSFYNSKTYDACPGRPGENQHIARAHTRARVFQLLSSDLLFYLLLKVPGQPGHAFNFNHFRSDIHPDAPGRARTARTDHNWRIFCMSLAALRDVYNPLAIKPKAKQPLKDWTESVPVVLLSEALKIVGKKHGISLTIHDDGLPRLCFRPGFKNGDLNSERWAIAEQATGLFVSAIDDLKELIGAGKLELPAYSPSDQKTYRVSSAARAAGPSRQI